MIWNIDMHYARLLGAKKMMRSVPNIFKKFTIPCQRPVLLPHRDWTSLNMNWSIAYLAQHHGNSVIMILLRDGGDVCLITWVLL